MKTPEIVHRFIEFFQTRQHIHLPAVPIVANNDPSLLFVNAGMNPFVGIFLGNQQAPAPRVVNSQPCLRVTGKHNDLEEVGHDTYHHTLFQMLGNWSFGDYGKHEAIAWAWELLTQAYHLPKERLYATVFQGDPQEKIAADKESLAIWKNYLPQTHILGASKQDNFWEMGSTGPCGPCTEIHIDMRSEKERSLVPGRELVNKGHPQVIELWNIVFIVYDRQSDQHLLPLAKQHVDTGMGLERLAMILQHTSSTYDTDAFMPLIHWLTQETGRKYKKEAATDCALRVVVDHLRAASFAIADGQQLGTQKGGYVIRRILRRAIRYGYSYLGIREPRIHALVPLLVSLYGSTYPRLAKQQELVQATIEQEETMFLQTLSSGLKRIHTIIQNLPKHTKEISGEAVFSLYDTFGFPPDLTATIAQEQGYSIEQQGFERAMAKQKARAKEATQQTAGTWRTLRKSPKHSLFVGYDVDKVQAHIVQYRSIKRHGEDCYQIILDKTPFYPEGGGQVGDQGILTWGDEAIQVFDTQKEYDAIIHYTKKLPLHPARPCEAIIDMVKRTNTAKNHTATHLLHAALCEVLGKDVIQQGSLVNAKKLRFDFNYPQKITAKQLDALQALMNEKIRSNIPLEEKRSIPMQEAKNMGALMTFEQKYEKNVRVVIFDRAFSMVLCGGTHVKSTGEIGFFYLLSEGAISAGIRRIEAVTGAGAEQSIQALQTKLKNITSLFGSNTQDPVKATANLVAAHKKLKQDFETTLQHYVALIAQGLSKAFKAVHGMQVLVEEVAVESVAVLKKLIFTLKKQQPNTVVILGARIQKHPFVVIALGQEAGHKLDANAMVQEILPLIQGQGGGNAAFALAKGKHAPGLVKALNTIRTSLFTT